MERIGVMTSGGDAPGMNAAIRAVVRTSVYHGLTPVGIRWGYQGMIDDDVVELGARDVGGIVAWGGTILGTARCRDFYEKEGRQRAAETLAKHKIEHLVVIGGEGSYKGAEKLHEEHGIKCIGLPGTIDNDIGGTDFTIGYDTALNTAVEAIDHIRDTAESHRRLFYVEVMGRHSGYIAMMCGIAGGAEDVLVPERVTDFDRLIGLIRAGKERGKRSSIVVVAEGDDAGNALDIARKVAELSEYDDYRVSVIGHLQRGGRPTASDRVLASRLGVTAVEALLEGETNKMAGVEADEVVLRPLNVAWEQRTEFDPEYLRIMQVLST